MSSSGDEVTLGDGVELGNCAAIGAGAQTLSPTYIARLGDDRTWWRVTLTKETLQIGCEVHPTKDWWAFDDRKIAAMDRRALRWWRLFKPALMALARARGWTEGMDPDLTGTGIEIEDQVNALEEQLNALDRAINEGDDV
jgi:hypothetical protein